MAAVAQRGGVGLLAAAQVGRAGLRRGVRLRRKRGALVRAIAERLMLGGATGAPVVRLPGFQLYRERALLTTIPFIVPSSDVMCVMESSDSSGLSIPQRHDP